MKLPVALILFILLPVAAWAKPRLEFRKLDYGALRVRIATQEPQGKPILGDILFVHGFSDRLDNHGPLFEAWNAEGFRVIAFDLPGHGENEGGGNRIGTWTFSSLAALAREVERATRVDSARPLFLAGFSTGGLLVARVLQNPWLFPKWERPVRGAILITPGIAVQGPFSYGGADPAYFGGWIRRVTLPTLTHDPHPPHQGPPMPPSILLHPFFALDLLLNATLAKFESVSPEIPSLVMIAGDDDDHYADSRGLKSWVERERSRGARVFGVQCPAGFHELDNESEPMGSQVRRIAARFPRLTLDGRPDAIGEDAGRCHF